MPAPASPSRTPAPAPAATAPRAIVKPLAHVPAPATPPHSPRLSSLGPGEPLPSPVLTPLENTFHADLSNVRIHQGTTASKIAAGIDARAFAYGNHIVLGEGAKATDLGLMAHEVTHVLQQRGAPSVQRCPGVVGCKCGADNYEREAGLAAFAAQRGERFAVTQQTPGAVTQRVGVAEFIEDQVWGLLEQHAPDLVPILRRGPEGVFDWIKDKVSSALDNVFNTLMAPVRAVAGAGKFLQSHFGPLVAWLQDAAGKIAQNNCKPIAEAAEKIEAVATAIITPIVEKVQALAGKVGDFFKGLWDRFGAPIWEMIKTYASRQWDLLKRLGDWIWDKTAPVRRLAARAWTWLKNKIGIGDGPEGQNGILQWIQGKAEKAWDWVKAKIEPYKKKIQTVAAVVAGILILVSPAGPVIVAGAVIVGIIEGIRWLKTHLKKGDAIVQARAFAQRTIIPAILGAVNRVTSAVTKMASAVSGKLGELSAGLGDMVGAAANTALQFVVDAAQWIAEQGLALASWANDKLTALATWLSDGLEKLHQFLKPVLDFLGKVANLLIDIWGLPLLLAGKLWNLIPACIRDPFVDWIIPLILRQIDFFKELVADNDAWKRTKADVMNLIRLVFVKKDLMGAIKAAFNLLLRALNIPIDLLVQVVKKAAQAWDAVMAKPVQFLKNCVRTVGRGFKLYWDHLFDNFMYGVEGWLFGELADKGIQKPASWTNPWDLAKLAMDVLGLSMDHVFELMEKKNIFSPETMIKVRRWFGRLSRAWDWIMDMRGKNPAEVTKAIITQAKEFGKSILEGMVTWVVQRVGQELAIMAAAAAASGGLSEVIDIVRRIYIAIKSAIRWMRKILEMVNKALDTVLDIVAGNIESGAILLEGAMKKATPVVIGFLGDQVGLGGVVDKIKEFIDKLRAKVDDILVSIMTKLKNLILGLVQGAKDAAAAILEWWKEKRSFRLGTEPHSLYFQGQENTAQLTVASTPTILQNVIAGLRTGTLTGKRKTAVETIEAEAKKVDDLKAKTGGSFGPGDGEKIRQSLRTIADNLAISGLKPVRKTAVTFTPRTSLGGDVGDQMVALPLTIDPGGLAGSQPYQESNLWKAVNQREGEYVQGHLLNHHVHGPGRIDNLVPISRSANATMEAQAEDKVKHAVLGDNLSVRYEVTCEGKHSGRRNLPAENELPLRLRLTAKVIEEQSDGSWKDVTTLLNNYPVPNNLPPDTPVGLVRIAVNLSSSPKADIENIPGIGPVLAERIVKLRKKLKRDFHTYDDLAGADGIGAGTVDTLRNDRWVRLY